MPAVEARLPGLPMEWFEDAEPDADALADALRDADADVLILGLAAPVGVDGGVALAH